MDTFRITFEAAHGPAGKLADVALSVDAGPLAGLRLVGFAIWERRGAAGYGVTFPARTYQVNGERRTFALLRAQDGQPANIADILRDDILTAWSEHRARQAAPSRPPAPVAPPPAPVAPAETPDQAIRRVARETWQTLTDNERRIIPLGVFPAGAMAAGEAQLAGIPHPSNALAVALMDLATVGPLSRPAPADVALPGLASVRATENPDPAPIAPLPRPNPADFTLRATAAPVNQVRFDF
jgi:hypothetical protein